MYKVSVIVPVYNVEKYIEKCLNSLICQTIDVKIIVINDGSTDGSEEILEKYTNKYPERIDYFKKENSGIADTRNYGVSKVETEYFGFLDSDDYIEPNMYELMVSKAEKENSDIVVSNFWWTYDDKEVIGLDGPYKPKKEMLVKLMATLWNKLYRTSIIKETDVLFPKGFRYEDAYYLYCIAPHINRVSFINQPLVHYVQREGSITHVNNEKVKDMIHVFDGIVKYYKERHIYDEYEKELEYLFTKFFLGNSFLRTVMIEDKKIREETLKMSIDILYKYFPEYYKNDYLKTLGGAKNKYFSLVRKWNYYLFANLFRAISLFNKK